ncbi:MAG TPA: hypothetical protein VI932_11540 [Bacteroidota bacterium]|nr:hypothetical protein [Bacteroidota bacterium]
MPCFEKNAAADESRVTGLKTIRRLSPSERVSAAVESSRDRGFSAVHPSGMAPEMLPCLMRKMTPESGIESEYRTGEPHEKKTAPGRRSRKDRTNVFSFPASGIVRPRG